MFRVNFIALGVCELPLYFPTQDAAYCRSLVLLAGHCDSDSSAIASVTNRQADDVRTYDCNHLRVWNVLRGAC